MESKVNILILGLLFLLLAGVARADGENDQFYFIAFEAPLGSISQPGQAQTGVVLRWDTLEGQLPGDLIEFEVTRNGTSIATLPAFAIMPPAQIADLYQGPENQRRLLEITRWLTAEAPENPVTGVELPGVLHGKLMAEPAWAMLAARMDLNIARARYRAWLDIGLAPGVYTYELTGRFSGGVSRRLGLVTTAIDAVPDPALPAAALEQVSSFRCDAPERMKAHGTVALNWQHPGDNATELYAWSLRIAGYDIYRTVGEAKVLLPRDLRALAAAAPHSAAGEPLLAGLEKVNDQPIVVAGAAATEQRYAGFNPAFSQFFETFEELAARGLEPGDRRGYYLVARDLSGNWGQTAGLLVTVPDKEAPPAPWNVRALSDAAGGRVALTWPRIDVRAYREQYPLKRRYCNLDTARFDQRLDYVSEDQQCGEVAHRRADLAVEDYLVYRFADSGLAQRFVDGDGDGFFDAEERPDITEVGTACDPGLPDPDVSPLENHLVTTVATAAAILRDDGRWVFDVSDTLPAANLENVYWYRVAARDGAGNVGPLSHPVRGFLPDRRPPARKELKTKLEFGRQECRHTTRITGTPRDGETLAVDTTARGSVQLARLSCAGAVSSLLPFEKLADGTRAALLSGAECERLVATEACNSAPARVDYLGRRSSVLATAYYPNGLYRCALPASELEEDCDSGKIIEITQGEVIPEEEGPVIDPTGINDCVTVWRDRGEKTVRNSRWCPGDPPVFVDFPDTGGDLVCLSVSSQNDNAQSSAQLHLPCFRRPGSPSPPTPIGIEFTPGSNQGLVQFAHAERPAFGAVIEWRKKGQPETRRSSFAVRAAGVAAGDKVTMAIDIGAEPVGADWREEWCVRGFSVGGELAGDLQTGISEWSGEACDDRAPPGAPDPQYLAWPQRELPEYGSSLDAIYSQADSMPLVLLSVPMDTGPSSCVPDVGPCNPDTPPLSPTSPPMCTGIPGSEQRSNCSMCGAISNAMTVAPGFVVYRQNRIGPAAPAGDYHQVTPHIGAPWCETDSKGEVAISTLNDPWIRVARIDTPHPWEGYRVLFTDRFPFRGEGELRYQFVFFDARGEIVGQRISNWVEVQ